MEFFIHNFSIWLESSKYVLLFLGCLVEGPVVMMVSGFLFGLGYFNLLPMYLTLVSGDFVADIGWYLLGRFGTRHTIFRFGHFVGLTPAVLEKVENRFIKYHQKILIISKLTMGLGFAVVVLMVAGMFKVPFKNYVFLNLVGGFIWTTFLLTIGYFFGNIFTLIPESSKIIFVISIFIVFIIIIRHINRYLKDKAI